MASKRKRSFNFEKKYTEEQLTNAVAAVKNKVMKYKEASAVFNVPPATIADRVKGHLAIDQRRLYNHCELLSQRVRNYISKIPKLS